MTRPRLFSCIALCLLLLSACASNASRTAAIDAHMARQQRLNRVASSVLTAGAPMCGGHLSYGIGLDNLSWDSLGGTWEQAYAANHGLNQDFRVQEVLPGSPADKAGIRVGDRVLALDGEPYLPGKHAYLDFKRKLRNRLATGAALAFDLEREGQRFSATVVPAAQCGFSVVMAQGIGDRASNDVVIRVPPTMIDFVHNDAELAAVISHELGHNLLAHSDQKAGAQAAKGIISVLTLGASDAFTMDMGSIYTPEFNEQADYLGVHLMELAGYDSAQALGFLQRTDFRAANLDGYAKDHPATPARVEFLKRSIAEVKARKENGESLVATPAQAVAVQRAYGSAAD